MSKFRRIFLIFAIVTFLGWLIISLSNHFLERHLGIKESTRQEEKDKKMREYPRQMPAPMPAPIREI